MPGHEQNCKRTEPFSTGEVKWVNFNMLSKLSSYEINGNAIS